MNHVNRSVIAFALIYTLACCHTLSAAPASKPSPGPVQTAAATLLKEYQSIMKDKKGEGLREKCDYFTTNKVEGITPELILATLEKPVSTDVRADAYVKWQLLSGVEGKFPDPLKARALKVYRAAPVPSRNPLLDHGTFDRALNRVGIMKQAAEPEINKEVAGKIKEYRDGIEPILSYRDELYSRLPANYDTLVAGLSDIYVRVSAGAPANEFWATVSAAARSWALTSSEAANMRQLASAMDKIRSFVKDDRNKPYYRVIWANEDKFTGLKWLSEATIQNDKSMEEAGNFLLEHSNNPGAGGLKFKNP